ncbi:MAG: tetratricopeptide repeat protein [Cyanobacteria bacterium J06635_1]
MLSSSALPILGAGSGVRTAETLSIQQISPKRPNLIAFTLTLGLTLIPPLLTPAPANACFFWQACARRLGQASNTRVGGKRTGLLRGGNDATLPYVITPRHTWVGEPPDQIRWNPVAGSNRYTVRLWQWPYERDLPSRLLWETGVEGTNEIAFPDIALALGAYYSIEVITEDGVSSNLDEGYAYAGFQQLSVEDYEGLRSHLTTVNTHNEFSPTEEATLAQAGVYFLDELYANALQILEPLALSPTASDLVYIALGDTYSETGLTQLAMEAYEQALRIATANNNILSEATIRVKLADVYFTLGDFDQARQLLIQAREAYTQLDAQLEISILDRRISVLSIL